MRMISWVIAVCLGLGLITYGVVVMGGQEVSAEISQEAKGSFVRLEAGAKKLIVASEGKEKVYPLSSTAWVYRNMEKSALEQLQAGDSLDIILNSKDQAAYIKAASSQFIAAQPSSGVTGPPTAPDASTSASASQQTPAEAAVVVNSSSGPTPAPAAVVGESNASSNITSKPSATSAPAITAVPADGKPSIAGTTVVPNETRAYLDKLSVEWKSRELTLRIKREGWDQAGKASDVYIQGKDRSAVHISGASAEAFIQQLVKGLPTEQKAFEAQLKQRVAAQFQLTDVKPEWHLDAKWQQTTLAPSSKAKDSQLGQKEANDRGVGKDKAKDKDKEKDKEKEKDKDKYSNKGKENSRDDD